MIGTSIRTMATQQQKRKNTNESDDDEYRDKAETWSGFHFTRLTCISILTLCIMIAGLILDNLSTFGKERECTFEECAVGACQGCGSLITSSSGSSYEYQGNNFCEANGACGWRTGFTSWIKRNPSSPGCPSCPSAKNCIESSREFTTSDWADSVEQFDTEFNYAELCRDDDDDEACMAMNGGNVYIAFTLFAIIFNLFTLCLIGPRMNASIPTHNRHKGL